VSVIVSNQYHDKISDTFCILCCT